MTYQLTQRGIFAMKAQASGWGTPEASFTTTDYLECVAPIIPPMPAETIGPDVYRPGFFAPPRQPGSTAPTTFSLRWPLRGLSATAPEASPTAHIDAQIIEAVLGGGGANGYTTAITTGSDDNTINVTNGSASAGWAGYALAFPLSSGRSVGWVQEVNTAGTPDTLTLALPLTGSAVAGTALGSYVAWLSHDIGDYAGPFTIDWVSNTGKRIRYADAMPTKVTITLAPKQQPMVEAEFTCLSRAYPVDTTAPAPYTQTLPQMPPCIGANGFRARIGTAPITGTITIELTQTLDMPDDGNGGQGVSLMVPTMRTVRVTTSTITDELSTSDLTAGAVGDKIQIEANTDAGRIFSFFMPAPQVAEQPQSVAIGNLLAVTTIYEPTIWTADTGSTAPADTGARCAFL